MGFSQRYPRNELVGERGSEDQEDVGIVKYIQIVRVDWPWDLLRSLSNAQDRNEERPIPRTMRWIVRI
jgi:hypothetical protein